MSNLKVNTINDASGGSTAKLYGVSMRDGGTGWVNRIINGEMRIDQRNNGASVTVSGTGGYTLDRWSPQRAGALSNFTCVRSTTAPIGYTNSMLFTMGTGVTPTSTDYAYFSQNIEGFNTADLGFGTTNAATVTLSFWVRSSVTGTFGAGLRNLSGGRCYIAPYTINSANTWEQKTVTIAGDTSGTWPTDNSIGIRVDFDLGVGPNNSTTGGTWQSVNGFGLTGGTKLAATSGATFYITGVQLEAGTVATPFERRDYGRELMMCQRYFERGQQILLKSGWFESSDGSFLVEKRTSPTMISLGQTAIAFGGGGQTLTTFPLVANSRKFFIGSDNGAGQSFNQNWTASAEL